ncbi:MAG TPA: FliH/SctL family protein [Marisediminicola sp.]|jgi:flagellar assembly protein FliH|nr:FliH/SctL family protein [Marisediminicola sp.]
MSSDHEFTRLSFPRLPENAQKRVEELAQVRGHAAGYTAGLRAARRELDERMIRIRAEHDLAVAQVQAEGERAVQVLLCAAQALNDRSVPLLDEAHRALAAASVDLAEAIIGRELREAEDSARSALDRALRDVGTLLVHTIRMHPGDLAALDGADLAGAGVTFIPDPTLQPGDAITEFPDGYLDARISSALERASAALMRENL